MKAWWGCGASTAALELPEAARVVHVTTRIGAEAMRLPAGVTLVDLSGLQLTSLGNDAFCGFANLTSIEAPDGCSLGAVGSNFAADTPQLRHVDVRRMGITSVEDYFLHSSGIEWVDLSGLQLTWLGHSAFCGCANLTTVEAPGGCP